jgi:hypothetical protein
MTTPSFSPRLSTAQNRTAFKHIMTELFDIWPDNTMYKTLEAAGYDTNVVGLMEISKEEIYALPPPPASSNRYYPAILNSTLQCWRSFLSYRAFNGLSIHPLEYFSLTYEEYREYVIVIFSSSQLEIVSSTNKRMSSPTKFKSPTTIKRTVDELFSTYAVQSPPAETIIQQDSTVDPPYGEVAPFTPSCEQVCTVDQPSMGSSTTIDLEQLEPTVDIESTVDEPPSVLTDHIVNTPTKSIMGSDCSELLHITNMTTAFKWSVQAWNTFSIDSSSDFKIAKVMATTPSPFWNGQSLLGCPPNHTGRGHPLLGRPPDLLHLGHGFPPPGRPPGNIKPTHITNDQLHLTSTIICTPSPSIILPMQLSS